MNKLTCFFIMFFILNFTICSDEIDFPPELLWWVTELKKVNNEIEINQFKFMNKETKPFEIGEYQGMLLTYPVFMRWNYYGNYVAYYNYHLVSLVRQKSGKYKVYGGDDVGHLFIADRDKTIFFADPWGVSEGLDAIAWLTDTVLVGVGLGIIEETIDVYICKYKINANEKNVDITTYIYKDACTVNNWRSLKLSWFEQRPDYFELDK